MSAQRISYVPLEAMDEKMQEEMYCCASEGTPRPESSAVRTHAPNAFSEAELVELGCFVALTFGQQSWIRLLGIEHHQYMAGSAASMAPGFRTPEELAASKANPDYWAATP